MPRGKGKREAAAGYEGLYVNTLWQKPAIRTGDGSQLLGGRRLGMGDR